MGEICQENEKAKEIEVKDSKVKKKQKVTKFLLQTFQMVNVA